MTVVTRGPRTGVNTSLTTGQIATSVLLIYIAFQLCSGFSLDEVSRGYPPVAELGFLIVVASLVEQHKL